MDGRADRDIFVLNFFATRNAHEIAFASCIRNIYEIEIEDNLRPAEAPREHEIRIHRVGINIDHEVRVDPVIEGAGASGKRTPLKTEPLAELNLVFGIFQNAVESFMEVRYVITAVKIVIDEHFPIAVEEIVAALEPVVASDIDI